MPTSLYDGLVELAATGRLPRTQAKTAAVETAPVVESKGPLERVAEAMQPADPQEESGFSFLPDRDAFNAQLDRQIRAQPVQIEEETTEEIELEEPPFEADIRPAIVPDRGVDDVTPQGLDKLVEHEGLRLTTYKDSVGVPTIGVGFNLNEESNRSIFKRVTGLTLEQGRKGVSITKPQTLALLEHTVRQAQKEAAQIIPHFERMPAELQDVWVNFVFNLGAVKASEFKQTLKFVEQGNGAKAAEQLLKSKWAKQVGNRATFIASVVRNLLTPEVVGKEEKKVSSVESHDVFRDETTGKLFAIRDGQYVRIEEPKDETVEVYEGEDGKLYTLNDEGQPVEYHG